MASAPAIPASHELRRQLANHWAVRTATSYPWGGRARPNLRQKKVCTLYFCSMDHCLGLDDKVIRSAAALAAELESRDGRTSQDVMDDLRMALRRAHDSNWAWEPEIDPDLPYTGLLKKLLVRVAQPESRATPKESKLRLGLDPGRLATDLDLVDFLGELYRRCETGDLRAGGAAALMAQALTRACPPGNVALWPAFLSPAQAQLFPADVLCLHLDAGHPHTRPARESGRSGHPESHSFPFEHGVGPLSGDLEELSPKEDGRVIVSAPLLHFSQGRVDRELSAQIQPMRRLLFTQEAGSQVEPVGREWKSWILTGLQGIRGQAEESIAGDLAAIPPTVTLHVEITGTGVTPWLVQVLQQHVDSLGIGEDELVAFAGKVRECLPTLPMQSARPPASTMTPPEAAFALPLFEQAAWLAEVLDLRRLYLHGHVVDLVIRRDRKALGLSGAGAEMDQEVAGTLFAKGAVASQAAGTPEVGHLEPGVLGLRPAPAPEGGRARRVPPLPLALAAMASLLERWGIATAAAGSSGAVDGASPWTTLTILKQGWFRAQLLDGTEGRACMVAVVPVIWFVKTPGHPLRTTGLGDVTSALSFYFGDYLVDQQAPKRGLRALAS